MMTFGEKLRLFVRAFARGLRVPTACYFTAMVLSERFCFPLLNTTCALMFGVWAYESVVFKQEDE